MSHATSKSTVQSAAVLEAVGALTEAAQAATNALRRKQEQFSVSLLISSNQATADLCHFCAEKSSTGAAVLQCSCSWLP